jgi:exodeoxyribonuclease VII small subunit
MTAKTIPTDMPFETAMSELEKIVSGLENGSLGLEDSIAAYERGVALRTHCEAKLKDAQLRVEKLSLNAQNKPVLTELDLKTKE